MTRNDEDDWIDVSGKAITKELYKNGIPNRPVFLLEGKSWSEGWDIPTKWAVDSGKQCWMNNAHGGSLEIVSSASLLSELINNNDYANIKSVKVALGLELKNKEEATSILKEKGFEPFRTYLHEWLRETESHEVLNVALDILKETCQLQKL